MNLLHKHTPVKKFKIQNIQNATNKSSFRIRLGDVIKNLVSLLSIVSHNFLRIHRYMFDYFLLCRSLKTCKTSFLKKQKNVFLNLAGTWAMM